MSSPFAREHYRKDIHGNVRHHLLAPLPVNFQAGIDTAMQAARQNMMKTGRT